MHLRFTFLIFLILKDKGTPGDQVEIVSVFHDDILYCTVNINLHIYIYIYVNFCYGTIHLIYLHTRCSSC